MRRSFKSAAAAKWKERIDVVWIRQQQQSDHGIDDSSRLSIVYVYISEASAAAVINDDARGERNRNCLCRRRIERTAAAADEN